MAILPVTNRENHEQNKFIESARVPGQVGTCVLNPDGTDFATGLGLKPYNYMSRAYDSSVTETYTFKTGGSGGTTTNTLTIVYTDSTLGTILSISKS